MAAVTVEYDGRLGQIRLDRPEVRNAAGVRTWPELRRIIEDLDRRGCRAAVLSGTGGWFCAGGDLKDEGDTESGPFGSPRRVASAHATLRTIRRAGFPVVAAVEGAAVGIGWALALACDVVVAAEDAIFSLPFLARGVVPDGGSWWHLQRSWGTARLTEAILSGRTVSATELTRDGVIACAVPPGTAEATAGELASAVADLPAETVRLTRRLLRDGTDLPLDQALDLELTVSSLNVTTGNPDEGRRAFLEHRPPRFAG